MFYYYAIRFEVYFWFVDSGKFQGSQVRNEMPWIKGCTTREAQGIQDSLTGAEMRFVSCKITFINNNINRSSAILLDFAFKGLQVILVRHNSQHPQMYIKHTV